MNNKYPQLKINVDRIAYNTKKMLEECQKRGLELVAVEKLVAANYGVCSILVRNGVSVIGDSRIANFKKLNDFHTVKKMMLRIPMMNELDDVVAYTDVCLVSELATILALNYWAKKQSKIYEIILMIETGDIREGLLEEKIIYQTVSTIKELSNVKLTGLGTNFACYGATIPEVTKLQKLVNLKKELEKTFDIVIPMISAGNSSHISIWDDENMPKEVNQIRSGAAIMMGIGLNDEKISFLKDNNFVLQGQIVEIQDKPSASWGKRGLDAFGKEFSIPDIGIRKKAIIAVGKQDVACDSLIPVDTYIKVLGGSSDHTILDITDCDKHYQIGDIVEFNLDYGGVLSCVTSEFVTKVLVSNIGIFTTSCKCGKALFNSDCEECSQLC